PANSTPAGDMQPMDDPGDSTNQYTGFYRVVQDGVRILDSTMAVLTNGIISNNVTVAFEAGNAANDGTGTNVLGNLECAVLLIDGTKFAGDGVIDFLTNASPWKFNMDTAYLENGTHTLQVAVTWLNPDNSNGNNVNITRYSDPITITVSNLIYYPNWEPEVGEMGISAYFVQTVFTNVDWEIDIYDVNGGFVNSQTGHSDDGNISWTWDLTDYTGASRKDDGDPFFYPYITITNSSGDPAGWTPPVANQFPSVGDWLFAFMDNFYDDGTTVYAGDDSYYTNGINTLEGGPALWGIGFLPVPLKYGRVYSQTNRDASWEDLQLRLDEWVHRNFYYFGHGAPNVIGGDQNTVDTNGYITGSINLPGGHAYLTSQWVHDNVTFSKTWGAMPFRFVFLDGCDTATGNWPWAWGVPSQAEPLSYYQSASNPSGARPSAFVGWNVELGGSKDWGTIGGFWQFRSFWMSNWSVQDGNSQDDLNDVFEQAREGSNWVPYSQLWGHLVIDGYQVMKFEEYNNDGDWP
ncbi:MAG: hypothetical protein ACREDS_03780, partial [Limisphaerales bacterium]